MNLKKTTLCLLSLSMMVSTSTVYAKTALEEIKTIQTKLLKNKESLNTLLLTKAHAISKETESMIQREDLSSAVRMVSLNALKDNSDEKLFENPNTIDLLLRNYYRNYGHRTEIVNPDEKIYSLTVINPEQLSNITLANEELKKSLNEKDSLLSTMKNYIDLSMKAKRYITYKEAEKLSDQIAKMNSDLSEIEKLSVSLKGKDQQNVEIFRKNMEDFLNKKLVFIEVAEKGFVADISKDFIVYFANISVFKSLPLNKDYSAKNTAAVLKTIITESVTERQKSEKWNDLRFKHANVVYKFSVDDLKDLNVEVSPDLKVATIQTKKYYFNTNIGYVGTAVLKVSLDGKEIYDHRSEYTEDYYNTNMQKVKALLSLVKAHDIQMKSIYKEFGYDNFAKNNGKVQLTIK